MTFTLTSIDATMEHLFRHEAGRLGAVLTRHFGAQHLGLIEDVVQEALLSAVQIWPYQGIPDKPAAWLWQVARSKAIDRLRRDRLLRQKVIPTLLEHSDHEGREEPSEAAVRDDQLRLMFICCHPLLDRADQVALTLKTVCGFGVVEVGRSLLVSEAAAAKRLVRARQKLRQEKPPFELPPAEQLTRRLEIVVEVLYLLFNEGYQTSQGDQLIRHDLCNEAIRAGRLLLDNLATDRPVVHGLLALMLFHASRFEGRVSADGELILLADQDRSLWDLTQMQEAYRHLAQAINAGDEHPLVLEATIAGCHCSADSFDATNWSLILTCYDRLYSMNRSPIVAMNRAIARSMVEGVEAGWTELMQLASFASLENYHLFHSTVADFYRRLNRFDDAIRHYHKALALTQSGSERRFLQRRMSECGVKTP